VTGAAPPSIGTHETALRGDQPDQRRRAAASRHEQPRAHRPPARKGRRKAAATPPSATCRRRPSAPAPRRWRGRPRDKQRVAGQAVGGTDADPALPALAGEQCAGGLLDALAVGPAARVALGFRSRVDGFAVGTCRSSLVSGGLRPMRGPIPVHSHARQGVPSWAGGSGRAWGPATRPRAPRRTLPRRAPAARAARARPCRTRCGRA
jgi:hypothetical protein